LLFSDKISIGDVGIEAAEATYAVTVQAETREEMGELAFLMSDFQ
jgi:hypothetical protein